MNYQVGDLVELIVIRQTQLGFVVLIDDAEEGLLFKSDVFEALEKGQELKRYAKTEKLM